MPCVCLRNVDETSLTTHRKLIEEIQNQFGSVLIPETHQLPVGYFKGTTKITIRTDADVADIWTCVRNNEQIALWCQGNHLSDVSSDSDDELPPKKKRKADKKKLSALEEKANQVEQIIHTLREKHGNQLNTIQYCLWVEMVDIGTHRHIRR